ncbi:cytochrome P450 monooxygenase [Hypoxylon crocopeplum]|nr:cytochrome P450 monooxygenase [Hypoxylon crocopeplum]
MQHQSSMTSTTLSQLWTMAYEETEQILLTPHSSSCLMSTLEDFCLVMRPNYIGKKNFLTSSENLMAQAREMYPNQPYHVMTESGERIVLPPEFTKEISAEPNLHFRPAFDEVDWHEVALAPFAADLIVRVASRTFIGEELCRNEEWIKVVESYYKYWFFGSQKLTYYPRALRMLVQWFLPECKGIRAQMKEARRLLTSLLAKRREMKQAVMAASGTIPKLDDTMEWFEDEAKARGVVCDVDLAVNFHISMITAARLTMPDLLKQFMIVLAQQPESVQLIREEVANQLRAEGMSASSFNKIQLLDRALKETLRTKLRDVVTLRRHAARDVQLSNGLILKKSYARYRLLLKKGIRIFVDTCGMRDPTVYENPNEWDPARSLKLRSNPDWKHAAQLARPCRNHLGFGYGQHACPGVFFAANAIKVILCHLLVKYEWKLAPGTDTDPKSLGAFLVSSPMAKILIRRRENVEVDFDSV